MLISSLKKNFVFKTTAYFSLISVIIFNLITSTFRVLNSTLDEDEFQHLHISWDVFNGKIIYKDFFEHHGPIYPLLNSLIFSIFHIRPGIEAIFIFRFISLFYFLIILYLIFELGKNFLENKWGGLFAAAFFSSLLFPQESLSQIRPDGLQIIFWLVSILLLLKNINLKRLSFSFLGGIFLGLSVLTNAKAMIGPASVIIYFLFVLVFNKSDRKEIFKHFAWVCGGIILTYLVIIIYFSFHNAVSQFFFCNYEFNIVAALKYSSRNRSNYFNLFLYDQTAFVFIILLGFCSFLLLYLKDRINFLKNKKNVLLIIISIVTSSTVIIGLYQEIYLIFLPLLGVAASAGVIYLYKSWNVNSSMKNTVMSAVIICAFIQLIYHNIDDTDFNKSDKLTYQEELTDYMLENSSSNEPVFFIWNDAGGYTFNSDPQYYWFENENFRSYYKKITGYDVYGEKLIGVLKEKKVRFISTNNARMKYVLSKDTYNYVTKNYIENKKFKNLWIRSTPF